MPPQPLSTAACCCAGVGRAEDRVKLTWCGAVLSLLFRKLMPAPEPFGRTTGDLPARRTTEAAGLVSVVRRPFASPVGSIEIIRRCRELELKPRSPRLSASETKLAEMKIVSKQMQNTSF